jgi:capsid protein
VFDRIKAAANVLFRGEKSIRLDERKKLSKQIGKIVRRKLQAHYDSASTTDENKRHWAEARNNTPLTVNSPDTRRKLRIRARYEHDNNCYLSGMVSTVSKDMIGSSPPKLQLMTEDRTFNSFVEDEWRKWGESKTVNLTQKLKLLDSTKIIEGEGFFLFHSDEQTERETNYSINPQVLSAARVTDPHFSMFKPDSSIYNDDGVLINLQTGRPEGYMLTDLTSEVYGNINVFQRGHYVSAKYLHQWFTPTRPQQYRGVCEVQAALTKFSYLRRYSLATVAAAEFAACLAGVMKTNQPLQDGPAIVKDYSQVELVRNMLISLPEGWEASQFEPKQPIAQYADFINTELREIGRLLDIPRGVMLGDSSAYNYSSARMDYQGYDARIIYYRGQFIIIILDPLFAEWYVEFLMYHSNNPDKTIQALIRSNTVYAPNGQVIIPRHTWQFSKRESIDPEKDANAAKTRMSIGLSNPAIEAAALGYDWEELLETYKKIIQRLSELGLTDLFNVGIMGKADAGIPTPASTNNTQPANGNPNVNGNGKLKV